MVLIGGIIIAAAIFIGFMAAFIHELICNYKNPFPLFNNDDPRLSVILEDRNMEYKTRSILEDMKNEI